MCSEPVVSDTWILQSSRYSLNCASSTSRASFASKQHLQRVSAAMLDLARANPNKEATFWQTSSNVSRTQSRKNPTQRRLAFQEGDCHIPLRIVFPNVTKFGLLERSKARNLAAVSSGRLIREFPGNCNLSVRLVKVRLSFRPTAIPRVEGGLENSFAQPSHVHLVNSASSCSLRWPRLFPFRRRAQDDRLRKSWACAPADS